MTPTPGSPSIQPQPSKYTYDLPFSTFVSFVLGVPLLDGVVGCWLGWLSLPLGDDGCCITILLLER